MLFAYDDETSGLLEAIKDELKKRGLVVWSRCTRTDFPKDNDPELVLQGSSLQLCMLIMKYPPDGLFETYKGVKEPSQSCK